MITTIAGTGQRGFSGDNGPALNAALSLANIQNECDPNRFEQIVDLFVDRDGNVVFPDSNNQRIRRITPQGIITTVAGLGERPPTNARCEPTGSLGDGGQATAARLYNPADAILHPSGNLILADQQNNRIRQVTPAGVISTLVGSGLHAFYSPGIPALSSPMDWPSSLAVHPADGQLYFAELHSNRVARLAGDGRLVTVAGTGFPGFAGDDGPATSARLSNPAGIAFDAQGNLFIADQGNHRIRRVAASGIITTVAGNGQSGFGGDNGPATSAPLSQPNDVEVDANNNLYIADMGNHRIRRVAPSGVITTVAGNGQSARGPDGVAATASSLAFPAGIALDRNGDLYILDWQNFLIRKVSFDPRPLITRGGIVNGASFAPAPAPVAPGSIISIFGVNLAASTQSAAEVPLPAQLAGTTLRINGVAAPLFFVSTEQINAQLPFETAPGTATVVVTTSTGTSATETFNVAPSAVGIFQFAGTNRAIVLNQDNTINGPENPESRGRTIVAFLTGQGAVDPPVGTGQAASLETLSRASLSTAARVGGVLANVAFLGLAPGFVGLAQANIDVPMTAATGAEVLLLIGVGQTSHSATVALR